MTATIPAAAPIALTEILAQQPAAGASCSLEQLQGYVFASKYAKYRPGDLRRETFSEAVDRVFAMHRQVYAQVPGLADDLAFAEAAVKDRLVLGSQRAMQNAGKAILDHNARLYNCTVSYCDRPRFFQEAEYLLLCGAGVGFSVQHHHIARMPLIARPGAKRVVHRIEDSIEGWSNAVGALVSGYFQADQPYPSYAGKTVEFDYGAIRPKGAKLSSSNGKAPGPEPLRRSLEMIRSVLDRRLAQVGSPCKIRPIDAYDMLMHASDAVMSGGTRRSATICLFSPDDGEMADAKTGNWFHDNPQRARSNNSALLLRDETPREQFQQLMRSVRQFGEPGFVWADSREIMFNPCVEIGMYPVDTTTGASGWAFCNLCEINMKACGDAATFARAAKAAAILGTLQAGYTSFPYLGETTERIVRREALLGVSMTGMMDNPRIAFDENLQEQTAKLILAENARVAEVIGINPAARTTCVKPAGTTSCILGTASGIHPHHASRYLRRVQANTSEAPLRYFKAHNPRAVEKSVWNPNGTDEVITFCVEVPPEALTKQNMSAVDLLKYVVHTQQHWVAAGKRPGTASPAWLSHNVSNTITVRETEWDGVGDFIYDHRHHLAGVSLLPENGDLEYPQAPFTSVWEPREIVQEYGVGSLLASGLIVDGVKAWKDNLWAACDAVLGRGEPLTQPVMGQGEKAYDEFRASTETYLTRLDWVRRAQKFATNYFGGDLRRMAFCLKRVQVAKQWQDLTREYSPVDYSLMLEERDGTKAVELDSACAGGQCQVGYVT